MLGEVCGPEGGGAKGRGAAARAQGARTRRTRDCGGLGGQSTRGRARTRNMPNMIVTLDVSKLSGWLKAAAPCRGREQGV